MINNFKISKIVSQKNFKTYKIVIKFQNFQKFQDFSNIEPYVIKQLLHLNLINIRFNGAEYNNIDRGFASFNIVVPCSIKPHIDLVQVQ